MEAQPGRTNRPARERRDDSRRDAERRAEKRARQKIAREKAGAEERARVARLDAPVDLRRSIVRRPTVKDDAFGNFAERFARFMGTARFLIYMTLFVTAWIGWNTLAPPDLRFDDYPFIFLTLMLSLQASYAAPLILLAQNRQEIRDRVVNEQDRQANTRAHADMEFLAREVASLRMALGEVATRDFLRSELRNLLEDLQEEPEVEAADGEEPDTGSGPAEPGRNVDSPA